MIEEVLATVRANPKIDPVLATWSWEVPFYLFLGGLAAGIMFFSAVMVVWKRDRETPFMVDRLVLWAPIAISVGMGALFLDLSHKLYVYRFYTSFNMTSPMSWGAWILVVIYPVCVLQILSTFRQGYPRLAAWFEGFVVVKPALDLAERYRKEIAWITIPFAVALGIYTGLLLNTFVARPFWNSGILPPLFLVSGLSTAAAVAILGTRLTRERHFFTRIDIGLIAVEMVLVALLVINLSTGSQVQLEAVEMILGGRFSVAFWIFFFTLGLVVPFVLESWEVASKTKTFIYLGPLLVIAGGYILRQVLMKIGLQSSWIDYANQFDPKLLELLH